MTEAAVETTEAVEYTSRQNRKYAQRKLAQAQGALIGRTGLNKTEKLETVQVARQAALKALDALDKAFVQIVAEVDFVPQDDTEANVAVALGSADDLEEPAQSFY